MNFEKLYRETFSQVRFEGDISPQGLKKRRRRRSIGKLLILAAAVCAVGMLGLTAYAMGFLNLRSFLIKNPEPALTAAPTAAETEFAAAAVDTPEPEAVLSLQGYSDSPESKATGEWREFLNSYDADGAIISEIGNSPTEFDEKYSEYLVYTQEMADKLEEIAAKYGLKLHKTVEILDHDQLAERVGGEFLGEYHARYSGYIYEDGFFSTDGDYAFPDGMVGYQLTRSIPGTLTEISLNLGDISEYRQLQYTAPDGTALLLALSPSKCLIICDLGGAYVTVNVLAGTDTAGEYVMTEEKLEEMADSIYWQEMAP